MGGGGAGVSTDFSGLGPGRVGDQAERELGVSLMVSACLPPPGLTAGDKSKERQLEDLGLPHAPLSQACQRGMQHLGALGFLEISRDFCSKSCLFVSPAELA